MTVTIALLAVCYLDPTQNATIQEEIDNENVPSTTTQSEINHVQNTPQCGTFVIDKRFVTTVTCAVFVGAVFFNISRWFELRTTQHYVSYP